ncbi:alpha/beta fold hydrolase [Chromohalobacter israelensis]|uniref:alpha/beta fold hydrolase n=1 Tax=Chromohalobacter israelensis TaxID=141390 RepID=UPI003D794298
MPWPTLPCKTRPSDSSRWVIPWAAASPSRSSDAHRSVSRAWRCWIPASAVGSAGEAGQRERENRHALLAKARQDGMRAMGGTWLQGMVHPERLDDETLVEAILAMIERKDPDTFAAQIDALLARPDATEQLAGIACPTLLLCGRQDAWSPLERHEEMAGLIPGSRLEVIEEAGHMSPMERPAAVARALDHWRNHA